ncbi:hypothetical protein ABDJ41_20220 [Pedobacter sp. ASV1-7]|uniref:hypothetical protein n=1 Tax=Pedobacter sp. ASV1-7 TaxID=3145237 RepID=UPI0032E92783
MKSKAIFLLVIFLLNTVVGFGCALAMEVGDHDEPAHHGHKDHDHHHAGGHEHKTTPISGQNFTKEDPCCKTLVNDLATQSKLVPEISKVQFFLPVLWLTDHSYSLLIPVTDVKLGRGAYADHRERPPNKDIRIVIQSFQI